MRSIEEVIDAGCQLIETEGRINKLWHENGAPCLAAPDELKGQSLRKWDFTTLY